jgi:hypothetical protein
MAVGGARSSLVVKMLGYKPESRRFQTQRGEILNLPDPSGRTRPWGLHEKKNVSGENSAAGAWG